MTVYCDDARILKGRAAYSHLWADSMPELLAMADRIGLKRKWLEKPPKARWVHFDILPRQRTLAIAYGAVLTDKYGPLEHEARGKLKSPDPERAAEAQRDIDRIEALRIRDRKGCGPAPVQEKLL